MPIAVFGIGGWLGAILLGRHLYLVQGWAMWQCLLAGAGILGIALLAGNRFGVNPPLV